MPRVGYEHAGWRYLGKVGGCTPPRIGTVRQAAPHVRMSGQSHRAQTDRQPPCHDDAVAFASASAAATLAPAAAAKAKVKAKAYSLTFRLVPLLRRYCTHLSHPLNTACVHDPGVWLWTPSPTQNSGSRPFDHTSSRSCSLDSASSMPLPKSDASEFSLFRLESVLCV